MPVWLRYLIDLVLAAVAEYRKDRAARQSDVDSGASEQKAAQDAKDAEIAERAAELRGNLDALSDEELLKRASRWGRSSP